MTKKPRRPSKSRRAVRPPVIDLKAEETKPEADAAADEARAADAGNRTGPATVTSEPDAAADPESSAEQAEPGESGKPAEPVSKGSGKLRMAGIVAALVVAAGLGAWLYKDFGAGVFGGAQQADIAAFEERLGGIEASVKSNAGKLGEVTQSLISMRETMAGLEAQIAARQTAGKQGLAAVEASIEELRVALSAASASGQGGNAGQAANKLQLDKLAAKLDTVSERMAKAETALGEAAAPVDPAAIGALEEKLGAVEKTVGALQERQSALATQTTSDLGQTFARLSGKLAGSEPFTAELDALANEAPAVPGVDVLRPLAATGVPSPGDLAAQLDKIAAELNKAPSSEGEAAPSDGGVMGALASKLGTVVKIRKIDEADWPSVLTNAAAQVRNGQLIAALSLITGQPGAAPEGLAAWLKSAENRVKADKALQQLSQAVLSRLAASSQNG